MGRRACLAIGVSTVAPPPGEAMTFGYLDGAGIAARNIGEWARRSGFGDGNVRIVTDEGAGGAANHVTVKRVQDAVDELFPAGADVVEQLVLAFCGHGLTDANVGQICWLFTDSLREKYRVVADAFFAELLLHGIERITLISDACREAPKDMDLMRLDPVRGIKVNGIGVESPKFDRFAACQDGQLGYMVSDAASATPGKCVFSGVITDVLWGKEPSALQGGVITTATFGVCVRSRTAERARDYRLKLNPQCMVDPEPAVLYEAAKPPQGPPEIQPWPPAATVLPVQPAGTPVGTAEANILAVNDDEAFRGRILGPRFNMTRHGITPSFDTFKVPSSSKDLVQDLVLLRDVPESAPDDRARAGRIKMAVTQLEADVAAGAKRQAAGVIQRSLRQLKPDSGPDGSNLIVSGGLARIWSSGAVHRGRRTPARMGYRVPSDPQGTPVLVEFSDGMFMPVVPYDRLYSVVRRSGDTEAYQAFGESDGRRAFDQTITAIADFAAGRLSPEHVDRFAAQLRDGKHADPVLGVICAYLYRAVADYDSIRRMAYFYTQRDQPIPFDVVLLGDLKVQRSHSQHLMAHVPEVRAREGRARDGDLPGFVTQRTQATEGAIGGRCPWAAVGWDYVGLAARQSAALVERIAVFAPEVPRTAFTLLRAETGRALALTWGLTGR